MALVLKLYRSGSGKKESMTRVNWPISTVLTTLLGCQRPQSLRKVLASVHVFGFALWYYVTVRCEMQLVLKTPANDWQIFIPRAPCDLNISCHSIFARFSMNTWPRKDDVLRLSWTLTPGEWEMSGEARGATLCLLDNDLSFSFRLSAYYAWRPQRFSLVTEHPTEQQSRLCTEAFLLKVNEL